MALWIPWRNFLVQTLFHKVDFLLAMTGLLRNPALLQDPGTQACQLLGFPKTRSRDHPRLLHWPSPTGGLRVSSIYIGCWALGSGLVPHGWGLLSRGQISLELVLPVTFFPSRPPSSYKRSKISQGPDLQVLSLVMEWTRLWVLTMSMVSYSPMASWSHLEKAKVLTLHLFSEKE